MSGVLPVDLSFLTDLAGGGLMEAASVLQWLRARKGRPSVAAEVTIAAAHLAPTLVGASSRPRCHGVWLLSGSGSSSSAGSGCVFIPFFGADSLRRSFTPSRSIIGHGQKGLPSEILRTL